MNVNNSEDKDFMNKDINNEDQEFENPKLNKVFQFVKDRISFEELRLMEEKVGFQKTILNIIKDSDNISTDFALYLVAEVNAKLFEQFDFLQVDKKAVKFALSKNGDLFKTIANKYKNDPEIGAIVVASMVRENKSFSEIENLIEQFFPKNKVKLYNIYSEKLFLAQKYEKHDFGKIISVIEKEDLVFYNLLLNLKIVKLENNNKILNNDFILNFINNLNSKGDYLKLDSSKKYDFKKNELLNLLGIIKISNLTKQQEFLIKTILDLVSIQENKISLKSKVIEEKFDEKEEKILENNTQENDLNEEYEYQELIDYVYPNSVIESYPSGFYINTDNGRQIKVTNNEMDKFNTKSLKNFINFYNTLYDLGLNFFWDKYKTDFITLCRQKTGSFDYISYEGISEIKILSILNIIGKNIGVPEEEVMGEEGEKTGKYVCFKTLGDAKEAFSKINSSGIISGEVYSDNGINSNSAVENKLIDDGLIDNKKYILNISQFK